MKTSIFSPFRIIIYIFIFIYMLIIMRVPIIELLLLFIVLFILPYLVAIIIVLAIKYLIIVPLSFFKIKEKPKPIPWELQGLNEANQEEYIPKITKKPKKIFKKSIQYIQDSYVELLKTQNQIKIDIIKTLKSPKYFTKGIIIISFILPTVLSLIAHISISYSHIEMSHFIIYISTLVIWPLLYFPWNKKYLKSTEKTKKYDQKKGVYMALIIAAALIGGFIFYYLCHVILSKFIISNNSPFDNYYSHQRSNGIESYIVLIFIFVASFAQTFTHEWYFRAFILRYTLKFNWPHWLISLIISSFITLQSLTFFIIMEGNGMKIISLSIIGLLFIIFSSNIWINELYRKTKSFKTTLLCHWIIMITINALYLFNEILIENSLYIEGTLTPGAVSMF
jgi:hypothetical protein